MAHPPKKVLRRKFLSPSMKLANEVFISYCGKKHCRCEVDDVVILYLTDDKNKLLAMPLEPEDALKLSRELAHAANLTIRCRPSKRHQ